MKNVHLLIVTLGCAGTFISPAASAEDTDMWGMCPGDTVFTQQRQLPRFDNPDQIDISAINVSTNKNKVSTFEGKVLIEKQGFRLHTSKLIYDQPEETMDIPSNMEMESENLVISSESGKLDLENDYSEFNGVNYLLPEVHMQGKSSRVVQQQDQHTVLYNTFFSSCPPGKESWKLSTSKLDLDHEDESGSGRNVVVRLGNVPIFYLPYISFPLGEHRRSGILTPEIKFSSSRNGYEFDLPYYWNIAPNQDATITPHYMRERGMQLRTRYRYLTHSSEGQIDVEYLDYDELTDSERYFTHVKNTSNITPRLRFDLDVRDTSDNQYLTDFGDNLDITSVSYLPRTAGFSYAMGAYRTQLSALSYETLDDTITLANRPYRQLPKLSFTGGQDLLQDGLHFDINAEWVDFRHEDPTKTSGNRLDAYPKFSWPLGGSYWFVTPAAGYRHTSYDLTDGSLNPLTIEDRDLPVYTFDSGLFFERKLGGQMTQTLEPRLFYLKVPYQDQSAIPLFDTTEPDFSFAQLFKDNRFIGNDRVGDADQLTLAVTTRFLDDKDGRETFTASIGQIQYFEDRQVNLAQTDTSIATGTQSDIAAELTANGEHWGYQMALLQNVDNNDISKGNMLWHFKSDNRHILNVGFRYRKDTATDTILQEEKDFSFKWPLFDGWSAIGKWNYSIADQQTVEQMAGFEYDSCCWTFRLVGRGYQTLDENSQEIFDRAIIFTLVLKGLGSTGEANKKLEHAIIGFEPEY